MLDHNKLPVWYENEAWAQYWADEEASRKADEAWEDYCNQEVRRPIHGPDCCCNYCDLNEQ